MFNVSENSIITITKGDNAKTTLFVNIGTGIAPVRYVLSGDDTLYFTVTEPNAPASAAVINKTYTFENLDEDGDVVIEFVPGDTNTLPVGTYFYSVKLHRYRDDDMKTALTEPKVNTIIPRTKFVIYE